MIDIEIKNMNGCVLSIPKRGYYTTTVSNKRYHHIEKKSGGIILPGDNVCYRAKADKINDLIIVVNLADLRYILDKNYNIKNIPTNYISLDLNNEKVSSVFEFIESSLQTVKSFPFLKESLLFKSNIKDITTLLVANLIADSLNIKPVTNSSPDSLLVKRAEELIDSIPERLFTVHEISEQLSTSPRNLQLAFKKHRNYSPMQFLRKRKLCLAHKLLSFGSKQDTIRDISLRAGILDMNRFSKHYNDLFGELPRDTKKKATN